jgi:hypothetical protein
MGSISEALKPIKNSISKLRLVSVVQWSSTVQGDCLDLFNHILTRTLRDND